MITKNILQIGDVSDNGQITIVDEDRLCYLVRSNSKGAIGLRIISKALLDEYVAYFSGHPNSNANSARNELCGKTEIDKFEYGYSSTLTIMAKMVIEGSKNKPAFSYIRQKKCDSLQQIFYGAPGTGKSHEIKKQTEGKHVIRTTFHPDSDYSTFVGSYKPTTVDETLMTVIGTKAVPVENEDGTSRTESKIVYEFVEQAFIQAYTKAWKLYASATTEGKVPEDVFLVIEEINRGNCAQIFGDLFQLLDRSENGFSEYPINSDKDLQKHLSKSFANMAFLNAPAICGMSSEKVALKIRNGEVLILPNNLYIWATMNTSDQSLFPIDSAFKRRWDWQYMPIEDAGKNWTIKVNGHEYKWYAFLETINKEVFDLTHSEDKQLGYFFAKAKGGIIDADTLVNKVFFYLWTDVFKDYDIESQKAFKKANSNESIAFKDFFQNGKVDEAMAEQVMINLGLNMPEEAEK